MARRVGGLTDSASTSADCLRSPKLPCCMRPSRVTWADDLTSFPPGNGLDAVIEWRRRLARSWMWQRSGQKERAQSEGAGKPDSWGPCSPGLGLSRDGSTMQKINAGGRKCCAGDESTTGWTPLIVAEDDSKGVGQRGPEHGLALRLRRAKERWAGWAPDRGSGFGFPGFGRGTSIF